MKCTSLILLFCFVASAALSQNSTFISDEVAEGGFTLINDGVPADIYYDPADYEGVIVAIKSLSADFERVSGTEPEYYHKLELAGSTPIIIGTVGKSKLIDQLINDGSFNAESINTKWESYIIEVISDANHPFKNALVIAGSDKRGTIFGIYELSRQMGVSPWYWWADVPPKNHKNLYVKKGKFVYGEPAVKYRGIFINDEEPALGRWAVANYGGFTSEFYKQVFELILRLKGNYLWPAMWWASFNEDDPLNPSLADDYGIVMGTTHHEPMNRAHADWKKKGVGDWNYETNSKVLTEFWREGIIRMGNRETIISLGMRGDGDMAMSDETNIKLLENIVSDQREIIADETGRHPSQTPQLWALYKEVQDYYQQGMQVPDDVTLLLCDDNWGNVRMLPDPSEAARKGGYGMYYHFDYVGGPRNYKWLNTSPIPRVWEQMHLSYRYGVDEIWIVNVGDIKPMELPISFFLEYAWDPESWHADKLGLFTQYWAEQQFGEEFSEEIAEILALYTKYNGRRKPELLSADVYSLFNYRETERVVETYNSLAERAKKIYNHIPEKHKDAYYQLVLYPVLACANLNELWVTVGQNRLYAQQGRAATNDLAERVRELFKKDQQLSDYYNNRMSAGKWHHMMDQTHISYTYWQQPEEDVIPELERIDIPEKAGLGVAVENSEEVFLAGKNEVTLTLPEYNFYDQQSHYIEIFNRGKQALSYEIKTKNKAILIEKRRGEVSKQERLYLSIDWNKVKPGKYTDKVEIRDGQGKKAIISVSIRYPDQAPRGFIESRGYVSIGAADFTQSVKGLDLSWEVLPDHGRTDSAVSVFPVTASPVDPGPHSPQLTYDFYLFEQAEINIQFLFSPTLNFHGSGLRYAFAIDDDPPQIINLHEENKNGAIGFGKVWEKWVAENIICNNPDYGLLEAGRHTLRIWMVDPGLVLQKIVIDTGGLKSSYLGPPPSKNIKLKQTMK